MTAITENKNTLNFNLNLIEYTDIDAVYNDRVTNSGGYARVSSAKSNLDSIKGLLSKNAQEISSYFNSEEESNLP